MTTIIRDRAIVILLTLILATQVIPGFLRSITFMGNCTAVRTVAGYNEGDPIQCLKAYVMHEYEGD